MLPAALILAGGGLILYGLWQLRRMVRASGGRRAADRLEELATDLLSAAEEASASLDRRTARLEELLRLADERLAALRQGVVPPPPAAGGDPLPAAPPGAPAPRPARGRRTGAAPGRNGAASGRSAERLAAGLGPAGGEPVLRPGAAEPDGTPAADAAAPAPPPAAARAGAGHHRRVWALADDGLDEAAIAAELHLPRGEVKLILGLRRVSPALGARRDT